MNKGLCNEASNESSSGGGVVLVVGVVIGNDEATVADVVTRVANNLNLGGGDLADALAIKRVAEDENCKSALSASEEK